MNVIFLFPYPLGQSPSQRFRFEQYLEHLASRGITYSTYPFWSAKTWEILYKRGHYFTKVAGFIGGVLRRFSVFASAQKADIVFIHRECMPVGPPIIEWLLARVSRKKIIYDFDDAIWLPNTSAENKLVALIKWHSKVSSVCRWSYKVSCGNSYLHDFARKYSNNVVINPTTIETESWHNPLLYSISKPADVVTIGWTGTHSTLKYLDLVIDALQKIEAKFPQVRLVVIADKKPSLPLNRIVFIPWSKTREIEDLLQFDIGIMPLADDIWAKGKCGFKALQYLSLNIPALASPVGVNSDIIDHGVNGFLCHDTDDWYEYLKLLIEDAGHRKQMGLNGRRKIIDHYSVSSNLSTFIKLLE